MSNQFENKQIWIVITPDETAEVLASFKYEHWAKDWRDKYSATSKVVEAMDSFNP